MAKKLRKVRFLSAGPKLAMLAEDEEGNVTLYEDVVLTDMECDYSGPGIVVEQQEVHFTQVKPLSLREEM